MLTVEAGEVVSAPIGVLSADHSAMPTASVRERERTEEPSPKFSWQNAQNWSPYKTQKARGVHALRKHEPFFFFGLPQRYLYDYPVNIYPHNTYSVSVPCFARPCPTTPRHGFVESQPVHSIGEVLTVVAKTLDADPNGEVIFMPELSGRWSGIINHAGVAFGLLNDGATAGHSTKVIPAYAEPKAFTADAVGLTLCKNATIKDTPYLEFVEDRDQPVFVQLRDGPAIPRSANYIPRPVTVTRVIDVYHQDLIEWERQMAEADDEGLVVYHPTGSLTSHYAVHCVINKIPVIVSGARPNVGDRLEPSELEIEELQQDDIEAIASMISRRFAKGFGGYDQRSVAMTAVATLHASPTWGRDHHLLRLRAEGVAAALIFSAAACIGEVRHWYIEGPGAVAREWDESSSGYRCREEDAVHPRTEVISGDMRFLNESCRDVVYSKALESSVSDLERWTRQASEDFHTSGWPKAYGGPAWGDVADKVVEGFDVVRKFIEEPSEGVWKEVMSSYNRVVNACHNNGKVLTKWITRSGLDKLALYPGPGFVNSFAAQAALDIDKLPTVPRKRPSLGEFLAAV